MKNLLDLINDWIARLANPSQFLKFSDKVLPWLGSLALIGLCIGLYWTFFKTPLDEEMGQTVIIMFVQMLLLLLM